MLKRLLFILLVVTSPFVVATQIIAHPSVPLEQLTHAQLRALFSMRHTQWPDGTTVRVIVLSSEHPAHQDFCKKQLRMFPYQLDSIWNKLSFSGIGTRPQRVSTEQEMQQMVEATPGAIGYRSSRNEQIGVQIIEIN